MKILLVDPVDAQRELAQTRIEEALRQVGLKRVEIIAVHPDNVSEELVEEEELIAGFLGPGCYTLAEQVIQVVRGSYPEAQVALILENDVYAEKAVELRRVLSIRITAIADIAQMAAFILDSEAAVNAAPGTRSRGVVSVLQLKGGVGASSMASALAACWARHDLSVALVDFDDVNPQITDWSRAGTSQRKTVAELLRAGDVPKFRVNELVNPVEGYDGKLVVVPQPERYHESFHYKADVLDGAPSAAQFVNSLLSVLREEFDAIVIDCGRSWGIATFCCLPKSQHLMLVTDDDGMSVRRTLDNLSRMVAESDDPQEFDFSRWSILLNGYTSKLISRKDLSDEIKDLNLFAESSVLYTVPFSERGRQWGAPGESFYDLAEESVRDGIQQIAFNLIPFKQERKAKGVDKLKKQFEKLRSTS